MSYKLQMVESCYMYKWVHCFLENQHFKTLRYLSLDWTTPFPPQENTTLPKGTICYKRRLLRKNIPALVRYWTKHNKTPSTHSESLVKVLNTTCLPHTSLTATFQESIGNNILCSRILQSSSVCLL